MTDALITNYDLNVIFMDFGSVQAVTLRVSAGNLVFLLQSIDEKNNACKIFEL